LQMRQAHQEKDTHGRCPGRPGLSQADRCQHTPTPKAKGLECRTSQMDQADEAKGKADAQADQDENNKSEGVGVAHLADVPGRPGTRHTYTADAQADQGEDNKSKGVGVAHLVDAPSRPGRQALVRRCVPYKGDHDV
jgi:hypothetical protein